MAVFLHIGASKCGSSALQTALTANPTIKRNDGSVIQYAEMKLKKDCIVTGKALTKSAGIYKYKASPDANELLKADLDGIGVEMKGHPDDLLFSSEGWLFQPEQWTTILDRLGIEVEVVIYVRPQVLVLNSAWWQWGAWSDRPFDAWMEKRLDLSMWGAWIAKWKRIPRVKNITVRPVIGDIVGDFYTHILNATPPEIIDRPNPSLSGPLLRLFQRNRSLRPTIHASRIDFALSDSVAMNEPSIWVMDKAWIQRVLDRTKDDINLLMSFMDKDCAQAVQDDPRWWSLSAYADRVSESPLPQPIPAQKLEELCVEMANAIYKLKQ